MLNFISYTLYGKGDTAFRVCMKKDPQLTLGSITFTGPGGIHLSTKT
jgi:hypothetical protein